MEKKRTNPRKTQHSEQIASDRFRELNAAFGKAMLLARVQCEIFLPFGRKTLRKYLLFDGSVVVSHKGRFSYQVGTA